MLLYPLAGMLAPVGQWMWHGSAGRALWSSAATSIGLTTLAIAVVVLCGTPLALYVARTSQREQTAWIGLLLLSILLPPLALGILLSIAFGPHLIVGRWLLAAGVKTANSPLAFTATQAYVAAGYYIVGAVAAFRSVPRALEREARLLGADGWRTFWTVTLPLGAGGLAAAVALAWARAIGEFGAVMVTAYYPASMPVQLWTDLQDFGLPAVMPLLLVFLLTALPLPWLIVVLAQRRTANHA